ncbi:hypothetical protein OROGR_022876 [Orobanche gracilis]
MVKRATWNDNTTKKLLDICVDEKENWSSKFDWGKIAKNLSVQTEMSFVSKQVQNHYEDLKVKYKCWVGLNSMKSGIAFDPKTNAVQVEEMHFERWTSFQEKHRKYANMLMKRGLSNVNELDKLFGGRTAHGERGFSPAMARTTKVTDLDEGESVGADTEMEIDLNAYSDGDVDVTVLELLNKNAPSPKFNKIEMVSFGLREMGVSKERGDKYFVDAMRMENTYRRACVIVGLEVLWRLLKSSNDSETRRSLRNGKESGAEYIHRLLNGHPDLLKEQLRLHPYIFSILVELMVSRKLLSNGRFILVPEQVGICLYILVKGASYRDVADRFQHSISVISYYFRKILDALVILSFDIIRPHADLSMVPPQIKNSPLHWSFFKGFIGAIDGTHIQVVISDSEGKYYLVDPGYPNTIGYLSPIMDGARYHIPDFKKNRVLRGMSE